MKIVWQGRSLRHKNTYFQKYFYIQQNNYFSIKYKNRRFKLKMMDKNLTGPGDAKKFMQLNDFYDVQ